MTKKLLVLTLAMISCCFFKSFGQLTYSTPRPMYKPMTDEEIRAQALYEYQIGKEREERFKSNTDRAFNCFNSSDYNCCIYWYEQSKKLGWTNASFDYITGISHFKIGNKSKAKKYLKLASKRGYYQAEEKLRELF